MTAYSWGEGSLLQRSTCRYEMQEIMDKALATGLMDMKWLEGHRGKEKQDEYFYATPQKSKLPWPKGEHNALPSNAADVCPVVNGKISWDKTHCCVLAGIILAVAVQLGYVVRWGGNWDMDGEPITDQDFQDLVHFEFKGRRA